MHIRSIIGSTQIWYRHAHFRLVDQNIALHNIIRTYVVNQYNYYLCLNITYYLNPIMST